MAKIQSLQKNSLSEAPGSTGIIRHLAFRSVTHTAPALAESPCSPCRSLVRL